jgi:hypothetical protein
MDAQVTKLVKTARMAAVGLAKVAAAKPDATELKSDANTFRGTARVLAALSDAITERDNEAAALRAKLQRIATLQVRGGQQLIQAGNWRAVVDELQALAQEALAPGAASGDDRRGLRPRQDG